MQEQIAGVYKIFPAASYDEAVMLLWRLGNISVQEYMATCKVSRKTAYNRLKKFNKDWGLGHD
tara:strand:+ start:10403 stop:10591 length:189 start_codon:yes stop_codon:yes gene_type:complete